jgi:hypothetical protein
MQEMLRGIFLLALLASFTTAVAAAPVGFDLYSARGGLYGLPPALGRLDGNGNRPFAVDFRDFYATALERWRGVLSAPVLNGRFNLIEFL